MGIEMGRNSHGFPRNRNTTLLIASVGLTIFKPCLKNETYFQSTFRVRYRKVEMNIVLERVLT